MATADKESSAGPPGDGYCNWLPLGKERIKQREKSNALQRLSAIKKLIPQSVSQTLQQIKQPKYNGNATFPSISDDVVTNNFLSQWDALCLNSWNGPQIEEEDSCFRYQYETLCLQFGDEQSPSMSHAFWVPVLCELWKYCDCIASEIFGDTQHVQLSQHMSRCLGACALVDLLKQTITLDDGNKTDTLFSRKSLVTNSKIEEELNKTLGIKLDVQRWGQSMDEKKVFKECGKMIQKEAGRNGKAFMKLFKVHKLNMKNARKLKAQQIQRENEMKATESVKEEKVKNNENTKTTESSENAVTQKEETNTADRIAGELVTKAEESKDCNPTDDLVETPSNEMVHDVETKTEDDEAGKAKSTETNGQTAGSVQTSSEETANGSIGDDDHVPMQFSAIPTIKQPESERMYNAAAIIVLVAILMGLLLRNSGFI